MLGEYSGYANVKDAACLNLNEVPHNSFWDTGDERELKMHRIHAYPAKFPAFITSKALTYARAKDIDVIPFLNH